MLLDGTFQVQTFGFPPLADREKSVSLFTGHDFFGGGTLSREDTAQLPHMQQAQTMNGGKQFVKRESIKLLTGAE
ncbi:hypothetical protein LXL04_007425 [Taraxacum kok-saghyz]